MRVTDQKLQLIHDYKRQQDPQTAVPEDFEEMTATLSRHDVKSKLRELALELSQPSPVERSRPLTKPE